MADDSEIDQKGERTPIPFIAALVVVVVVIGYIVISSLVSPAEDNVSDAEQIRIAAHHFVEARSEDDAERKRDTACTGFDETAFAERVGGNGGLTITEVTDPAVDSDRATAEVTTKQGDAEAKTTTWTFTKQADDWVVC